MPLLIAHKLHIPTDQHAKLKRASAGSSKQVSIKINNENLNKQGTEDLLLTAGQILKLQQARAKGTPATIIMRRKQIEANKKHDGGFLFSLLGLSLIHI